MKRLILLASVIVAFMTALAAPDDIKCGGIVVDDLGEPAIGATVAVPGTSIGTATDIDGRFSLNVPKTAKKLVINYVGYKPVEVSPAANLGTIVLKPENTMLQDVIVTQSVAKTRKTPVAISQVDQGTIDLKLGNQEFPEVLKTTPGVWATKDGGGFGDAKINMRGFKSYNIATMINGVPVNDMEWGGVYWSNWAGLSDVTSNMQTQRGLGANILSAPSVGGTINVTTKTLDAKRGGTIWYGLGNDNTNQMGFSLSTGAMKNGWAVTILGSRRWSPQGYVQGTEFNAWTWFINVSKRINDAHQLSFTAFGAPQTHNKRSSQDGLSIAGWQGVRDYMDGESPYRYNPTYGFDKQGQQRSSTMNFYHKPQISLTHIWQINPYSSWTNTVYVSISKGGGYSGQGRKVNWNGKSISYSSWYGASNGNLNTLFRHADGTFAYDEIQDMNAASTTGSNMVMSSSNNNHEWYGWVSNYRNELLQNKLVITAGLDVRYYIGHHNNKIIDLYDGAYYMDDSSRANVKAENNIAAADPAWKYEKLKVGDIVYRDYDGHVHQEGVYGQAEYTALDGALTTVISGSLYNKGYWRVDRFYYDKEHGTSDKLNFLGGSIKGGVNYNINRHNNVFFNIGYISNAPFFSQGAFLNSTVSNVKNPNPLNEKVFSAEVGYGYHSPVFSATVNAYYTRWFDKTSVSSNDITSGPFRGERYVMNMSGVGERHMGIELNFTYQPVKWLSLDGMLSMADWTYDSNATGAFYTTTGIPLTSSWTEASGILAPDHAVSTLNIKGVKVGGSAQTTAALGVNFKPFKGVRLGVDWVVGARNYSDQSYTMPSIGSTIDYASPWEIPWGNQFDINASWRFRVGGIDAVLSGNVYNVFNNNYIMDAYTATTTDGTWENAYRIFYSFGTTFAVKLKLIF